MVRLATKGKEVALANVQNKDAKSGQKKSEEKNAYLSNHAKKPRSLPRRKSPRRATFDEQLHNQDRFTQKESVWGSRKKKEVIEQVYRVKRDGRKSANSDLILKDKEPIKKLALATKGKEVKQSIIRNQSAKSEEKT